MKPAHVLLLAVAVAAPMRASAQNAVTLDPLYLVARVGEPVSFDLGISFSQEALGGGVVVEFDPARLAFESYTFDASFPDDPALRLVCPSAHPACADFPGPGVLVAFAVDTISFPPISGDHTVGRIRLTSTGGGFTTITLREDDSVAGPIVGVGDFDPPALGSAQLLVTLFVGTIPALGPIGMLLLALGLGVTGARRRKRASQG